MSKTRPLIYDGRQGTGLALPALDLAFGSLFFRRLGRAYHRGDCIVADTMLLARAIFLSLGQRLGFSPKRKQRAGRIYEVGM